MDLDEMLELVQVVDLGSTDPKVTAWWPPSLPWGVSTPNDGVIALFAEEEAANHYRLTLVTQLLNPSWACTRLRSIP